MTTTRKPSFEALIAAHGGIGNVPYEAWQQHRAEMEQWRSEQVRILGVEAFYAERAAQGDPPLFICETCRAAGIEREGVRGRGVSLRTEQIGRWFCAEHWPGPKAQGLIGDSKHDEHTAILPKRTHCRGIRRRDF